MTMNRRSFLAGAAALVTTTTAGAAPGTAAPKRCLLVAGQSLAAYWYPHVDAAVIPAFRRRAGKDWSVCVAARGGTGITTLTAPERRWLEEDMSPGPVLLAALAELRAWKGPRPTHLLWSQGQADGAAWKPEKVSPEAFVFDFMQRTDHILRVLRHAVAGPEWKDIPAYVQVIGWRREAADGTGAIWQPPGYELVRYAQTRMCSANPPFNVHLGPVQAPWSRLRDYVHPATSTYVNDITAQMARLVS